MDHACGTGPLDLRAEGRIDSGRGRRGQEARAAVERAREQVAMLIGASDASEIIFTSGGSESDVLAIAGAARQAFDETKGCRRKIVTTKIEHDAIGELLVQMRRRGFDVRQVGCNREGFTNAQEMSQLIDESTAVVSLMHSNNETGVLQPVDVVASAAKSHGVPIHTDAVQSLGKVPLNVQNLGVDLLALSGHKLNAPKGIGALYVRRGTRLSAVITGRRGTVFGEVAAAGVELALPADPVGLQAGAQGEGGQDHEPQEVAQSHGVDPPRMNQWSPGRNPFTWAIRRAMRIRSRRRSADILR
jgi:selenocysteine lyase/cysteine desulfurase